MEKPPQHSDCTDHYDAGHRTAWMRGYGHYHRDCHKAASRIVSGLKRCSILRKTGTHRCRCDVAALKAITRKN